TTTAAPSALRTTVPPQAGPGAGTGPDPCPAPLALSEVPRHDFAPVARDEGVQRLAAHLAADVPHRAGAEGGLEAVPEVAAELGYRARRVVGQVLRLGPRHRLGRLDDHDRVRGAVGDVRDPDAALALEDGAGAVEHLIIRLGFGGLLDRGGVHLGHQ